MKHVVALVAILLLAGTAQAQQGTAEIRGRVVDQQKAVLPGVTVTIRNQDTGMYRSAVTTGDGTYFLGGVTPGVYAVTATLQGFKTSERRDVRLEVGKTAAVNVTLQIGGVEEAVTVQAEPPLVDTTSKEIGGNITSRELTELPSINRNFIGFIGLLPGIVPNISTESFGSDSVSVNGQDPRNNNYLVDGGSNNDDVIGQRAGMQARTALEAIQEFQVISSQFDAEFGRTTGAVVNAVTKQGSNDFKGSAFGFVQDAALTAEDFFVKKNGLEKPDTKQRQWGGTLGGPIVRDKAHFFFSLERVAIDRPNTINIPSRPEFNAAPTTNDRVWNTMIRGDHQINANHTWGVRWLREQSPQRNQIIGRVTLGASREESDVDQTVVGTLNSVLGNSKVNTVRMNFTRENVAFANPCFNGNGRDQSACDPTLSYLTFTDQQSTTASARINNAWQLEDTMSWFKSGGRGDHDIKFGLQYQYVTANSDNQSTMNGQFNFASDQPFDPSNPSTYPERLFIRVPGPSHYFIPAHYLGLFAQDKWRMNAKLTLSLGLRYDLESVRIPELQNPFFSLSTPPTDANNLQPRIGFSYDVTGDGKSVVRGGYGLFFDKTHFELITALVSSGVFSDSFTAAFPANGVDPGPSSGQFPTDPLLVDGPVVNRSLVSQLFPPGSTVRNTGNVFVDNPDRRLPYTHEVTVGYERQIARDMSVSADYVHSADRAMLMSQDLNAGLRATTSRTAAIVDRPNAEFSRSVFTRVNVGRTDYDSLQLQVDKRFSHGFSARVAYMLARSDGNTGGGFAPQPAFQLLDDLNLGLDVNQGPTDYLRRNNLVVSGSALVPRTGGLTFSWVARYLGGEPLTITDSSTDPDRNGILFDPLPAGSYSGTGDDPITVDFNGRRNGATGPNFFQLDTRLGYRLRPSGDMTVDLFGEVFNLTDRANFATPTGDRRSTNFLTLTDLRSGAVARTAQFGFRIGF